MKEQRLKELYEKKIRPELGRIRSNEKYLKIVLNLTQNSGANSGKGIRESQLPEDLKPATHVLKNLAGKGFVEITLPIGDGTLLVDPINNRRELFKKREMIDEYHDKFVAHMEEDSDAKEIVKKILELNETNFMEWINSLEDEFDFTTYNQAVFGLLENGIELIDKGYGPLNWRKMAKYYNISDKTKKIIEEEK